jgi:hypothetical protein
MAMARAVLGTLVVIAVVMMGGRFRHEPRRWQLHPHLGRRPAPSLTTSAYIGRTYSPSA